MPEDSEVKATACKRKVTGGMIGKYIEKHCEGMKCPACGSEKFPFIHAKGADAIAPVYFFRELKNQQRAMGFYLLSCKGCGFLWKFDMQRIASWAQNHNHSSESEE